VRHYFGNTGYAGSACYLHDSDPSLAFCGPMEFHRDPAAPGGWKLTDIMWVPDTAKGESFKIDTGDNIMPQRFTSSISGQRHEYLYLHGEHGQVVFVKGADGWKTAGGHWAGGLSSRRDRSRPVKSSKSPPENSPV